MLLNKPNASACISGWLSTLMEYLIVIEYVREFENNIANAFSRLDLMVVKNEVFVDLARRIKSFACPATQMYCLIAWTDLLDAQHAANTISFVADLLSRRARFEPADIKLNLQLKPFADVWPQLVFENELVKHFNELAVSTGIVVSVLLHKKVFCLLHIHAHHEYEATIYRILQRNW